MRGGIRGFCPDCADDRILLPVDDAAYEFCCTGCDAAVLLLDMVCTQVDTLRRTA